MLVTPRTMRITYCCLKISVISKGQKREKRESGNGEFKSPNIVTNIRKYLYTTTHLNAKSCVT